MRSCKFPLSWESAKCRLVKVSDYKNHLIFDPYIGDDRNWSLSLPRFLEILDQIPYSRHFLADEMCHVSKELSSIFFSGSRWWETVFTNRNCQLAPPSVQQNTLQQTFFFLKLLHILSHLSPSHGYVTLFVIFKPKVINLLLSVKDLKHRSDYNYNVAEHFDAQNKSVGFHNDFIITE